MTGKENTEVKQYALSFGESFLYCGVDGALVGTAAYIQEDGYMGGRVALFRSDEGEALSIGSSNVIVTSDTDAGLVRRITVHPLVKSYPSGLPLLMVTFNGAEPVASVQQQVSEYEFATIPDGLQYDGRVETEVFMYYGKRVFMIPIFLTPNFNIWLDRVGQEDRVVIDSGKGIVDAVWLDRPTSRKTCGPIIQLLDHPEQSSSEWRISLADEIKKLRYQVIEKVTT